MNEDQPRFISTPKTDSRRMSAMAEVLGEIWRYKYVVPLVAALTVGLVAFWVLRQTKIYQATATLEYVANPQQPMGRAIEQTEARVSSWELLEFYETQNFILRSRTLAERVARRLRLMSDADFMRGLDARNDEEAAPEATVSHNVGDAASVLLRAVEVAQVRDTRVVRISVQDRNPERAQRIANAWSDEYIEKSLEDRLGATGRALQWLDDQMKNLKSDVESSEIALYKYREQHRSLSASLEDREKIITSQLHSFSNEMTMIRARRIQASAKLGVLRESLAANPDVLTINAGPISGDHEVASLRDAYRSAAEDLSRLSVLYGDSHPQVRAARLSIDSLRGQLQGKIRAIVKGVEAELQEYERAEKGLLAAMDDVNRQGHALSLQLIDYSRLERERTSKANLYETVMEKAAETDLARALRVSNARTVDAAIVPLRPISPKVNVWIGGSAFFGLVFGVVAALIVAYLDNKVRGPADMEARGVTLLGVLPTVGNEPVLASYGRRRRNLGRRIDHTERDMVVHLEPRSTSAECCRTIRTNLTFQSAERPLRAIAVTSAMPKDGKTTVAINVATVLAQSGRTVLLVDTDLRKPRLHRAFKAPAALGVSSILSAQATLEEAAQSTQVPGLSILASGPIPPNPSELLHTRRFAELIKEATDKFDTVIFDTPPLGAVTDPAVIATQVDGTVMVVRSGTTTRAAVDASLRQLNSVSAHLLGVVLNAVNLSDSEYGSYYASYRGYYAEDGTHDGTPPTPNSATST